jgi:rhodanese-related sulfurtransferase
MNTAPREASPQDVQDQLARYHIVDVREANEFEGPLGHLADAAWIALSELESRVEEIPAETPLLVVCRSGNRSGKACEWLAGWGRPGATNLTGGMLAWHAAELPVVRARFRNARAILESFAQWWSQVKRIPLDETTARVRAVQKAEKDADPEASPSAILVRTITHLERELRAPSGGSASGAAAGSGPGSASDAPADLGLVCDALRGDAEALDRRADGAESERAR